MPGCSYFDWCEGASQTKPPLYLIIQNRSYRGEIRHKNVIYPSEHTAIIDASLWDTGQKMSAAGPVLIRLLIRTHDLKAKLLAQRRGQPG